MKFFDNALEEVFVGCSVIKILYNRLMTGYPFMHRNVGNVPEVEELTIFDVRLHVLGSDTGADKDRLYPCWSMPSQA